MHTMLDWPQELAGDGEPMPAWAHAGSNLCLDFHGDPTNARLVVFSDGNHHMALGECLAAYARRHPEVGEIFYVTTPPGVLLDMLAAGRLRLGNLAIAAVPHLFISPPEILERAARSGRVATHVPFMRSRGNVLLVRHGNPKGLRTIADLNRQDVRLFLSNPEREAASHNVYRATLEGLARRERLVLDFFAGDRVVYGERIHHREAPTVVAQGTADAACVYYHLALRYTRIFPGRFDIVALDGTPDAPAPENVITRLRLGLVDDGGPHGASLRDYLLGAEAADIYNRHGLLRDE